MAGRVTGMRAEIGSRHLLPHERWLVQNVARRNMPARNRNARRALQKYGPEGAMLWTAATANILAAYLAGIIGVAVLMLSGGNGTAGYIAAAVIIAAVLLLLLIAPLRAMQCFRVGRAYRANRYNLVP
jgi:hypothetical protein